MGLGALKIPTVFTAIDKVSAITRKMTKSVVKFGRRSELALARTERRVRKLTPSFRGLKKAVGGFGLVLGGAALIGILGSAIQIYGDFEQANVDLTAVMGTSLEQNKPLIADARRLGSTTAKTATEVVGLQEAFARLSFTQTEILDVTEATINGSIAMNSELAATAELTAAMIRTFDDFSSADAPEILDQMTLATQKSALTFEKLQTGLPIVSAAANAAGIPFTKLVALLGKLSDSGIDASSSATALRNIFLESSKQGLTYDQILEKIVKNQNQLTAANDEFGKRGAISGVILAKQLKQTEKLNVLLKNAAAGQKGAGVAARAADKRMDTLQGTITLLSSAYEGFILNIDKGSGSIGNFIKDVTRTATVILALVQGTSKAEEKLTDAELRIRKFAESAIFFGKVLGVIIAAYIAANIGLKIWRVGMIAFNLIMGISAVVTGAGTTALGGNAIALGTHFVLTKLVTAAQFLWNAAMLANPIGLIILGIAAMIALVTIIVVKYEEWGAALSLFFPLFGGIINLIMAFRRSWQTIQDAFRNKGILAGILEIGRTIIESLITPIEQLLVLISKIPGAGALVDPVLAGLDKAKDILGVTTIRDDRELVNPVANAEAAKIQREEANITNTENRTGTLTIENNTGNQANLEGNFTDNEVKLSGTQGF